MKYTIKFTIHFATINIDYENSYLKARAIFTIHFATINIG